jgi:hypothetical protein
MSAGLAKHPPRPKRLPVTKSTVGHGHAASIQPQVISWEVMDQSGEPGSAVMIELTGHSTYSTLSTAHSVLTFDSAPIIESVAELGVAIEKLSVEIQALRESNHQSDFCTFISTLGIDGFELKKPIPITVTRDGDGFIAGFLDANISTGGETLPEAIANLQSLLVDLFKDLSGESETRLGPEVRRQKRVLMEAVCQTS